MVLNGDGIGPEIMAGALDVIKIFRENFGLKMEPVVYDIGARSVSAGKWTVESVVSEARKYRTILKAPMGDPSIRNTGGTEIALNLILALRFDLDLFANVRPVRLIPGVNSVLKGYSEPESINYTILRENSEGLYSSHFGGLILRDEVAIDNQTITRRGTERISKFAFGLAEKSYGSPLNRTKEVICVDKSNVLKSFAFFRKIFTEVADKQKSVSYSYMYADAMAQYMLLHPEKLNVVLAENMFGDILSDLGAATVGGLGFAYSANMSEDTGMFEPVHGSAPDIAGKNIANPVAMMLSTGMMLDFAGFSNLKQLLERSLFSIILSGTKTPDMGGNTKESQFISALTEELRKN